MRLPFKSIGALLIIFQGTSFMIEKDHMAEHTAPARIKQDTTKGAHYIPEKVTLGSFKVLTITDTAFKMEDIGRLLNKRYGELFEYVNHHNLKSRKVMAFYYTATLPFVFEAAVEVNNIPGAPTGRIKAKELKGGDAIVVHYQGPYNNIRVAYAAITKWLKEHNKKERDQPFEVYLNDPVTVKDPELLRTDVYQRLQ